MSRLITFGCSMTHGFGLNNPQEEVWGYYVGKALNKEHINQGGPGASNKFISYRITNFNYRSTDTVIVFWSFKQRYCILKPDGKSRFFLPTADVEDSVNYYKNFYNDFDHEYINKVYVTYSIDFLIKNKIKFYQLYYRDSDVVQDVGKLNLLPLMIEKFYKLYPKAPDNAHLGVEGNKALAIEIVNNIVDTKKKISYI